MLTTANFIDRVLLIYTYHVERMQSHKTLRRGVTVAYGTEMHQPVLASGHERLHVILNSSQNGNA